MTDGGGDGFDIVRFSEQHLQLLREISAHLNTANMGGPAPFRVLTTSGFVTTQNTRGQITSIHNPTANPITVILSDGQNPGDLIWSGPVPPATNQGITQPFFHGVYLVQGAGVIVSGNYL